MNKHSPGAAQAKWIFDRIVQVWVILHGKTSFTTVNKEITNTSHSEECTEILDTGSFSEHLL
jgi:hypothetical protein